MPAEGGAVHAIEPATRAVERRPVRRIARNRLAALVEHERGALGLVGPAPGAPAEHNAALLLRPGGGLQRRCV
eukprot:1885702-Alexandrium_andersonii.AAC.1